ncbi:hypothetical protein A8B75_03430 [Sphingomonadales bacterium EhC05]|nr:hypothetical protein A8B75_03430 [Sphingomonadales bacterium EhC05]
MNNKSLLLSLTPALLIGACSEPASNGGQQKSEEVQKGPIIAPVTEANTIDAGLAIGEQAPLTTIFATKDGDTTLAKELANGPALLVFTRSVQWCPFCQTQLKAINGIVGDLKDRGYNIYGVSYDNPGEQDRFSQNQMLAYPMLSDESSAAIDAFGLRDPQYTEGRAVGVPYASVIIVDKDGKIVARNVSGDYKMRPTNDQILAMVDAI